MLIKSIHVACAYATGLSFLLRGILSLGQSPYLRNPLVRLLPHCIDTVLLTSAITLLVLWSLSPLHTPWLLAKIVALLAYIGFGFAMLRFGSTSLRRWTGFAGGLGCYAYIVAVAHSKSVLLAF